MNRLNWFNIEYWINKGFTEDEAIKEINRRKTEGSCRNKAFWIKRGFTEDEAVIKIKNLQSSSSLKGVNKPKKNIYSLGYWIEKGFSKEDSLKKVEEQKLKSNMYKILSKDKIENIIKKRNETYYTKTKEERLEINKRRGRNREQLIEKFGIEEANNILNKRNVRGNKIYKRYSKISKTFFDELSLLIPEEKFIYGEKEKWLKIKTRDEIKNINGKKENAGTFVDFYAENTKKVIEFYGNFYHANPKLYTEDAELHFSKVTIHKAKNIWDKDKIRESLIISKGYDLLIIWEQELKQDKKILLEKCINFIKN